MANRRSFLTGVGVSVFALSSCGRRSRSGQRVRLRLQWFPQTQFAGYLVAKELGFYQEAGLQVEILPAGPDIKPAQTVASGSDDFGVGVSNQIISARANGVPLKIVSQTFQDSANRYILKKENRISSLSELRGQSVGLWLGGDEAEFIAMLAKEQVDPSEIRIVPQDYSVAPFLEDQYLLSQVTVYNELLQIEDAGYPESALQIISPADYDCAIPSDMLFTSEWMIENNPEIVKSMVQATNRGWAAAFEEPERAARIAVAANSELVLAQQVRQLEAVKKLTSYNQHNDTLEFGRPSSRLYEIAQRSLLSSNQISNPIAINDVFSSIAYE